MKYPLLALVLLISAGPGMNAQEHANFPWWNSPIRSDLGLTPTQTERIRQIVHSYRDRLLDARNEVQKAQGDLEEILNDPNVNFDTAKPVIDRLANARANSSRVFLEMSVRLRSVLTLDQWRILVRRWDEQQKRKPSQMETPPE
ncbi:MAG: periplasmic heavy metal sensor [Acidobacteriaceae bacterium]|nr:periplasmic heavy metal sensor [Acidobacteriaceae bacterium]MBV9499963.1 periplasmic heavy metal sensor [Acidobacteriaceae bacterium]